MRHGESKVNVAEIILSHPKHGTHEDFTLTENGEKQARDSAKKAKTEGLLNSETIIYSSPFSRCKKTAEITKEVLGVSSEIYFDDRLRERFFGDFERTHNSNYRKVWDVDINNPDHKDFSVESAQEVQNMTLSLINDLEKKYSDKKLLLKKVKRLIGNRPIKSPKKKLKRCWCDLLCLARVLEEFVKSVMVGIWVEII